MAHSGPTRVYCQALGRAGYLVEVISKDLAVSYCFFSNYCCISCRLGVTTHCVRACDQPLQVELLPESGRPFWQPSPARVLALSFEQQGCAAQLGLVAPVLAVALESQMRVAIGEYVIGAGHDRQRPAATGWQWQRMQRSVTLVEGWTFKQVREATEPRPKRLQQTPGAGLVHGAWSWRAGPGRHSLPRAVFPGYLPVQPLA